MRVTFLAPRLPPAVCGVADHTQKLAEAMAEQGVEVGFIHTKLDAAETVQLPGPIDFWDGDKRSLIELLKRQRANWLWVQLSGYGYSRWGAPFILGQAVAGRGDGCQNCAWPCTLTRPIARPGKWVSGA